MKKISGRRQQFGLVIFRDDTDKVVDIGMERKEESMSILAFSSFSPRDTPTIDTTQLIRS